MNSKNKALLHKMKSLLQKTTFITTNTLGICLNPSHKYNINPECIENFTDGHMVINRDRPGSILIAPANLEGEDVYVGDMPVIQGGANWQIIPLT